MPLLNYTTTVPASRTIGQVQALLVEAGARAVATEYDEVGRAVGMRFTLLTTASLMFTLPVRISGVLAALKRDRVESRYQTAEHAERVAWRILKDWVEAQLAIIKAGMASLDEVMLPYMIVDGGTVYEQYRQQAIESGRKEA